jgi:predicted glutamine amidotransferase
VCRLLGFVARGPVSVVDLLGEDDFETFTALTAVHGDGWGMAWQQEDGALRAVTSAASAVEDPAYARHTRRPMGRAGMVHLRWATPGLAVSAENTHPFVRDGYAFAHNGHIAPVDRLEGLLDPATRATLAGSTDSERYFGLVRQCITARGDEEEGLREALDVLCAEFPEASLNALMLTPTRMFGVHINSRASVPLTGLRRLVEDDDELPHRHVEEYFAMDYRVTDDAVEVISSGIDEDGWTPVPENTAASVDLATLEITRLDL